MSKRQGKSFNNLIHSILLHLLGSVKLGALYLKACEANAIFCEANVKEISFKINDVKDVKQIPESLFSYIQGK